MKGLPLSIYIGMICNSCPRKCKTDREKFIGKGFCKTGFYPKIARIAPHYDEEPVISGKNGSGAIFFSGCNMKCCYCQNYEISDFNKGVYITPAELTAEIMILETKGVHNIDFITGSHYTDSILETLNNYRPRIPVIYNSSGYDDVKSLRKLKNRINIYLPDFKYSDNDLSLKYSKCPDYVDIVIPAIKEMIQQVGNTVINEDGLMEKGILIRHMVLPNHTKNSINVLEMINSNFGNDIKISLMGQYTPCHKAAQYDLDRKITKREYEKVIDRMIQLGFDGYVQELSSSDKKYIPKWDYTL